MTTITIPPNAIGCLFTCAHCQHSFIVYIEPKNTVCPRCKKDRMIIAWMFGESTDICTITQMVHMQRQTEAQEQMAEDLRDIKDFILSGKAFSGLASPPSKAEPEPK